MNQTPFSPEEDEFQISYTVNMAVAAVNKASDDELPDHCIVPPPSDQRAKAIRAANLAAMFCCAALRVIHQWIEELDQSNAIGITDKALYRGSNGIPSVWMGVLVLEWVRIQEVLVPRIQIVSEILTGLRG